MTIFRRGVAERGPRMQVWYEKIAIFNQCLALSQNDTNSGDGYCETPVVLVRYIEWCHFSDFECRLTQISTARHYSMLKQHYYFRRHVRNVARPLCDS